MQMPVIMHNPVMDEFQQPALLLIQFLDNPGSNPNPFLHSHPLPACRLRPRLWRLEPAATRHPPQDHRRRSPRAEYCRGRQQYRPRHRAPEGRVADRPNRLRSLLFPLTPRHLDPFSLDVVLEHLGERVRGGLGRSVGAARQAHLHLQAQAQKGAEAAAATQVHLLLQTIHQQLTLALTRQ